MMTLSSPNASKQVFLWTNNTPDLTLNLIWGKELPMRIVWRRSEEEELEEDEGRRSRLSWKMVKVLTGC
jgi:hypothetical protein